ncbi:caspase domain-containing protein [Lactarius pseudohatsudake]|nr:caspase domain-containing protein [Lactarius pseudohatsudake]
MLSQAFPFFPRSYSIYTMPRSHPSRSGDSSRSNHPDSFPVPNVPGGYGGPQGHPTGDTYTPNQQPKQQPARGRGHGHPQPLPLPHPHQLPVPQTNPIGGHASAISRVHRPQPKTGYVNDRARPSPAPPPVFPHAFADARTPDRAPPPSYPFGAPGVPEQPYPPVQSYGASPPYEVVSSHASGSRSQVRPPDYHPLPDNHASRNPPTWPQPQPLYDVGREYQPHRPYPHVVQPFYPRVGQKKALLVGINYSRHPDRGFRLEWGVFDACEMARFLHESCGFEWSNMQILTDDQSGSPPTKANILAAMRWLVKGAQPGDALFFYFSGHATQVKDLDGDDSDGLDECMCAMDYRCDRRFLPSPDTPGIIVDDDINRIMIQPLPQGCRLTAVLDCCHSGTLLDLPFILPINPNTVQQKSSPADVISLSACKDRENAFEVPAEGGALRKAFIECMTSSGSHGTCYDVIRSLLAYMRASGLRQQPQLSSSHGIDIKQRFTIV